MPVTKAVEGRRAASSRPVWATQQDLLWHASKAKTLPSIVVWKTCSLLLCIQDRVYQMEATWALSLRQRESYTSLGVSTGSFSPHIHPGISEDQLVPVFGVVFCP